MAPPLLQSQSPRLQSTSAQETKCGLPQRQETGGSHRPLQERRAVVPSDSAASCSAGCSSRRRGSQGRLTADGKAGRSDSAQEKSSSRYQCVVLPKHLIFSDRQLEAEFRQYAGRQARAGEAWLAALKLAGWLTSAACSAAEGKQGLAALILLWVALPTLIHLVVMLAWPGWYLRHRDPASALLRAPHDAWMVLLPSAFVAAYFSDPVPTLGLGPAAVLPPARMLACSVFQLVFNSLLSAQTFAWSFAYNTAQLVLWLICARIHASAAAVPLLSAVMLLAYAGSLALLYRREAAERVAFAAARVPGLNATALRARVASDPFAPLEFVLPAAIAVWSTVNTLGA